MLKPLHCPIPYLMLLARRLVNLTGESVMRRQIPMFCALGAERSAALLGLNNL